MDIIPLGALQQLIQPRQKSGIKSRVKLAFATVHMFRTSGVVQIVDGACPPVERCVSKQEARAYNAALDLLANFFTGEITDQVDVEDDELPGPDLATLPKPDAPAPASAKPETPTQVGPVFVMSAGTLPAH